MTHYARFNPDPCDASAVFFTIQLFDRQNKIKQKTTYSDELNQKRGETSTGTLRTSYDALVRTRYRGRVVSIATIHSGTWVFFVCLFF